MAVTRISAELMPPQFSEDDGVTWLTPVCITDWNMPGSTTSSETDTFCGKFTDLGVPGGTGSVNAEWNSTPAAGELSMKKVDEWWINKTPLVFRTQYPATGTPGSAFYRKAAAKITNMTLNGTAAKSISFSFDFSLEGTIDNTP